MSTRTVIQVEDLHKHYRLGAVGATQLGDDLRALAARIQGRPDPRRPVDAEGRGISTEKDFWALRGVSFSVHEGETLGIVGRNGAGKSTLLKLLSRITVPTRGTIRMRGRVSSLLEVGTGFHPELTGRENIYLNGAILGMRRTEVTAKLDEIIAFSGIEHHIDTPIKRYSSGMKVRLGFGVAAHLEPEILIVDEVLAVGDAEFQRKCMGKMRDVAGSGRTVLFVSHNMIAVRNLCPRVVWLSDGVVLEDGPSEPVVNKYLKAFATAVNEVRWEEPAHAPGDDHARLRAVRVRPGSGEDLFHWEDTVEMEVDLENLSVEDGDLSVTLRVFTAEEHPAFSTGLQENRPDVFLERGLHRLRCTIPARLLNAGLYRITVFVVRKGRVLFKADLVLQFEVQEGERGTSWFGRRHGVFRLPMAWQHQALEIPIASQP